MLTRIHSGFISYKIFAHDQIRAPHWTIWLMNNNAFLESNEETQNKFYLHITCFTVIYFYLFFE